jgi:hypothetical protein
MQLRLSLMVALASLNHLAIAPHIQCYRRTSQDWVAGLHRTQDAQVSQRFYSGLHHQAAHIAPRQVCR